MNGYEWLFLLFCSSLFSCLASGKNFCKRCVIIFILFLLQVRTGATSFSFFQSIITMELWMKFQQLDQWISISNLPTVRNSKDSYFPILNIQKVGCPKTPKIYSEGVHLFLSDNHNETHHYWELIFFQGGVELTLKKKKESLQHECVHVECDHIESNHQPIISWVVSFCCLKTSS